MLPASGLAWLRAEALADAGDVSPRQRTPRASAGVADDELRLQAHGARWPPYRAARCAPPAALPPFRRSPCEAGRSRSGAVRRLRPIRSRRSSRARCPEAREDRPRAAACIMQMVEKLLPVTMAVGRAGRLSRRRAASQLTVWSALPISSSGSSHAMPWRDSAARNPSIRSAVVARPAWFDNMPMRRCPCATRWSTSSPMASRFSTPTWSNPLSTRRSSSTAGTPLRRR